MTPFQKVLNQSFTLISLIQKNMFEKSKIINTAKFFEYPEGNIILGGIRFLNLPFTKCFVVSLITETQLSIFET